MAKKPASIRRAAGGGWKPRVFFWLLIVALLLLAGAEVVNAIRRPSLTYLAGPAGVNRLVLYQKGRAGSREAWLLTEPQEEAGPPVCFQWIDCTGEDKLTGELRWTFDGLALYATRRQPQGIEATARPLWVYEFSAAKLWSLNEDPERGHFPMTLASEKSLVEVINRHRGKGPAALSWYDLGRRGEYLFAWQITRWEKVLPPPRDKSK